jgi:chaperonin GroES
MALKPLGDRVIIERIKEDEQKSDGGIIIPDTAKEKPVKGKVIAVGPGAIQEDGKRTPMEIKVGETVLYGKYAGTEMKVDGQEVLIMRESDILAVIE